MPEDFIKLEEIKTIAPTKHIDLDQRITDELKKLDPSSFDSGMIPGGIYIGPEQKANLYPGNHTIITLEYDRKIKDVLMRKNEGYSHLNFEELAYDDAMDLLHKVRRVLNEVFEKETDTHQYRKRLEIHEETHQSQEIRLRGASLREEAINMLTKLEKEEKTDGLEEIANKLFWVTTFHEVQAFQQSLVGKSMEEGNKSLHAVLTLSDIVKFLTINEKGENSIEQIYKVLKGGKIYDTDKKMFLINHYLLTELLLVAGDLDLPEKVKSGEISEGQFGQLVLNGIRDLTHRPERIVKGISQTEITKKIEGKLQTSIGQLKEALSEHSA